MKIDTSKITDILGRFQLDLKISAEETLEGLRVSIIPLLGVEDRKTFRVDISAEWYRITSRFIPADYAGDLMLKMGEIAHERMPVFSSFIDILQKRGSRITIITDGKETGIEEFASSGESWSKLEMEMSDRFHEHADGQGNFDLAAIGEWLAPFWGAVVSLLPLLRLEEKGRFEGSEKISQSKRYERSPINREACIALKGCRCAICGFDFEAVYGSLGSGFIHVHHLTPVSDMKERAPVNPKTDLIPVCPNCHAMLHSQNPPIAPNALIAIIRKTGKT